MVILPIKQFLLKLKIHKNIKNRFKENQKIYFARNTHPTIFLFFNKQVIIRKQGINKLVNRKVLGNNSMPRSYIVQNQQTRKI